MKRKKIIIKILGSFLAGLIIYILLSKLIGNWQRIKEYEFSLNIWLFLLSILMIISSVFISGLIWRKLLAVVSRKRLNLFLAIRIHISSWLNRYIPGKINSILTKIYLTNQQGINKRDLTISVLYENLFIILTSLIAGIPAFIFLLKNYSFDWRYYLGFLIIFLICIFLIFTSLLGTIMNYFLKLFKREEVFDNNFLSKKNIFFLLFYYLVNRVLIGISFFILINSIFSLGIEYLAIIVGIFSLASLMGILINLAPGGIGIREGALVIFLGSLFPLEAAILISLLSRIVSIIADLFLLLMLPLIKKA